MPRPPGRPPSDEPTEVIPVRIRVRERERLDRYLDVLESRLGLRASRSGVIARALTFYLDAEEASLVSLPLHAADGSGTRSHTDLQDRRAADRADVQTERTTQSY